MRLRIRESQTTELKSGEVRKKRKQGSKTVCECLTLKRRRQKVIMAPNLSDTSSFRVEVYVPSPEFFSL